MELTMDKNGNELFAAFKGELDAQTSPDEVASMPEVDIVVGNGRKSRICGLVMEKLAERSGIVSEESSAQNYIRGNADVYVHPRNELTDYEDMGLVSSSEPGMTRAYIKIQDGCNRFCTYCIIPYARGRVRSKPLEDIKNEAESLAQNGFKELVLVGINLSAYGQELGLDIKDAVRAVCGVEGITRVRLGSIEPERMTEDILSALAAEEKFCPHFHLSLQSGCDATLKRMHRHYDTAEYRRIVSDIRRMFDDPSITTDVMVGFVGESEEDFRASVDFCDEIGFARTHVFPYSRRKGTAADKMDGHIDEREKRSRAEIMIEHTTAEMRSFMRSQVGLTMPVLFETTDKQGYFEGYTPNYTKVKVRDDSLCCGEVADVKLTEAFDDYCEGVVVR